MSNFLFIALGGALGAMSRYGLSNVVQRWCGVGFAWGTLTVNLLGCFLIGLAYHLAASTFVPSGVRFFIVVGFLGAFTTFSTFSLENVEFLRDGDLTISAVYILASNLLGVVLTFAGLLLGHRIHSLLCS